MPNSSLKQAIKCWQDAYKLVKEQVDLIKSSQGIHEILYLSYLILIVTIQLFLTLSPLFRGESVPKDILFYNIVYFLYAMFRLYVKCHYAEQIPYQVNYYNFTIQACLIYY